MGMYDYVKFEERPSDMLEVREWQTKEFDCQMETYTIKKDGRLIHGREIYEDVPKEERPYWGTKKWEEGIFQICGSIRVANTEYIDTNHHGLVHIIGDNHGGEMKAWVRYVLKFTDGNFVSYELLEG